MGLGNMTWQRIREAVQGLVKQFEHRDEQLVFAITNRYPAKVALYAAAFEGGWRVQFLKSLSEAAETAYQERPKAVFYDHAANDPAWDRYCSSLSNEGIPFVFLANRNDDQNFLKVLTAGGYHACGDPLTSEEIVKAVDFAGEVAALGSVAVV